MLPATPSTGDYVVITDGSDWLTNSLTILSNGSTIEGVLRDILMNLTDLTVEFIYSGSTWEVTATTGAQGISGYSGVATSGFSGFSGIAGAYSVSGISGFSGDSGYSGTSGRSGWSGTSGRSGTSGISGWSGFSSFSGTSGFSGSGTSGWSGTSGISGFSGVLVYSFNPQTGTTYTLVLSDASNGFITLDNGAAITVTIPLESSVAFSIGSTVSFFQLGAGQVTFVGEGGVTLLASPGLKLIGQYSGATAVKAATNTWYIIGALSA